ncbi:MAG: endonuclease III [Methanospirillaceae archaeon]|nr:endonuclease III [Methanospirillaceae archaeon]
MPDCRACSILVLLQNEYDLGCHKDEFLVFDDPYQILIATILSAQTTDQCVNRVTKELFFRYPDSLLLAAADPTDIESIIHSTGFFRMKARNIIQTARLLNIRFDGKVPCDLELLQQFPGVGRKTANIVMHHAFGINEGIAVDTHVRRVSRRTGLTTHADPAAIEQDLMVLFPRETWGEINSLFILHGRKICKSRLPFCSDCCIRDLCDYYNVISDSQTPSSPIET